MTITSPAHLTDRQLEAELGRLAREEREATVALLLHLGEFDARRLYEGAAFSSTFQYCRAVLRLSEDAIYNRIEAARAAREYPVIVEMLRARDLSPTTVRMLRPHLTPANHAELLSAASGMGKREVEHLLARWFPRPDVAPIVRRLPSPRAQSNSIQGSDARNQERRDDDPRGGVPTEVPGVETPLLSVLGVAAASGPCAPSSVSAGASDPTAPPFVPRGRPARVRPLAPERYEIRFTASAQTREKLRTAQDLLGHAIPSGDIAAVMDRALTLLIAELHRRKCAATSRPRSGASQDTAAVVVAPAEKKVHLERSAPPRTRPAAAGAVPAAVRRIVWARDGGRCMFMAASGRRCDARRFLEFHHVHPRAAGGLATVENIQLRCRAHNGHEVDLFFGSGVRRGRGGARGTGGGDAAVTAKVVPERVTSRARGQVPPG